MLATGPLWASAPQDSGCHQALCQGQVSRVVGHLWSKQGAGDPSPNLLLPWRLWGQEEVAPTGRRETAKGKEDAAEGTDTEQKGAERARHRKARNSEQETEVGGAQGRRPGRQ